MDVFRILYAIHFVLGLFFAIRLWLYIPAILILFSPFETSARECVSGASVSVLSVLWYFVWYGSIRFAVSGRFPILSVRVFAATVALVYIAAGFVTAYVNNESFVGLIENKMPLVLIISVMVALAFFTAVTLPGLMQSWEIEQDRKTRIRDARLDQMFRCDNPRTRPDDERVG
jgi:hypothetical protein